MTSMIGTGTLVRLALRRDRIRLPAWFLVTVGLVASTAASIKGLYPDAASRQTYADSVGSNPASAVLGGPGYGLPELGGITVAEMASTTLILVALVSSMFVIRHTRKEEETGRAELLRSGVVGRHAPLSAALIVAAGFNLLIAAGTIASLVGYGLPVAGSVAFGLSLGGTGLLFATVAAVAAQLAEHSRTANGIAIGIFGASFILRAVGDASAVAGTGGLLGNLFWFSPVGWALQVRAYGGERWWTLGLIVLVAVALTATAAALSARRDVGAGLLAARLGRPVATARLAGPWSLAWRLQRGSLIGWTIGLAIGAAMFGSLAQDITDTVGDNPDAARVLEDLGGAGTLVDSYLAWVLTVIGLVSAAYAVTAILRLRSEETDLRAEPVLGTAVPRWKWMASHLVVALTGTTLLLLTGGLVIGLIHGARSSDIGGVLPDVLGGALVQLPAALVLAAIAAALFGVVPRFTVAAWLAVGVAVLISQLGAVLRLSQGLLDLSPFTHLPRLPGGQVTATPLVWLGVIVVALTAAGLFRFGRRDIGRT